jgi:DNA-binding MarR family transcriptional regulator
MSDQVLALIADQGPKVTVGAIVHAAYEKGVSSPATTHKKINQLVEHELIRRAGDSKDHRKRFLTIAAKGSSRLEGWGK